MNKLCLQCKLKGKFTGTRKICNKCYLENMRNGMQFCAKCETLKLEIEFSRTKTICRTCIAAYAADYRELPENKKKKAANSAAWYILPENKSKRAAYRALPERKAKRAAYNALSENKAKREARKRNTNNPDLITAQAEPFIRLYDCVICDSKIGDPDHIGTVDHLKCTSKGGVNHWLNMAPMCKRCNNQKGTKTLEEFLKWRQSCSI